MSVYVLGKNKPGKEIKIKLFEDRSWHQSRDLTMTEPQCERLEKRLPAGILSTQQRDLLLIENALLSSQLQRFASC